MRTTVNPGSRLTLEGHFELGYSLAEVESNGGPHNMEAARRCLMMDSDSGALITLADLLRSFLEDPAETATGPVRITIEAAR